MKKIIISTILFFIVSSISYGQVKQSFFVVHADPHEPNGVVFSDLEALVDTANSFNVKLTIELSKQWCDTILASSTYLTIIRKWQVAGNEIGVHHHDYQHPEWDGYSNDTTHGRKGLQPYLGDMSSVFASTDSVCGDSLCLTVGTGPDSLESVTDYNTQWIYRTEGAKADTSAFSDIESYSFGPYSIKQLSYTFLENNDDLNGIQALFSINKKPICGVVTHVWNWAANKAMYVDWFQFISNKTPGKCLNVRQIMRQNDSSITGINENINESIFFRIYPNPSTGVFTIENDKNNFNIEVFNSVGQLLFVAENTNQIDLTNYASGIYALKIDGVSQAIIKQ